MLRLRVFAVLVLTANCQTPSEPAPTSTTEAALSPDASAMSPEPLEPPEAHQEPKAIQPAEKGPSYAGWGKWCEPHDWDTTCSSSADCTKILDPSGRATECGKPWWSNGESLVCMPAWPRREDRQLQIDAIRAYVDSVCVPPRWWRPRKGMVIGEKHCDPDKLHALLVLVATRESTLRPWKRHRLSPDINANKSSWFAQARRYGWLITAFEDGKGIRSLAALSKDANPFYADRSRWQGLGLYGQNTALHVALLDPRAPPEALCRTDLATETYLRQLRAIWKKLEVGITCDGVIFHGSGPGGLPTWVDLHRGASTGRICGPHPRDLDFVSRAARVRVQVAPTTREVSLDLNEGIPLTWLGRSRELAEVLAGGAAVRPMSGSIAPASEPAKGRLAVVR